MYFRKNFATGVDVKYTMIDFTETYYNRRRFHSTIGYQVHADTMDTFTKYIESVMGPMLLAS